MPEERPRGGRWPPTAQSTVGRRAFLAAAGAGGLGALAGCFGVLETEPASREPPLPEDRPNEPYVPSHVEGMAMVGMQTQGRYACALSYTWPHRFWLVRGSDTDTVDVRGADDVHMMASVWDTETGVVLPNASPSIEYTGPEDETESFSPWQMLSQRMGVHHGDNVTLGPEGVYSVSVQVAPPSTRRTATASVPTDPLTFDFEMTYERDRMESLSYEDIPDDREGTPGAVDPMDMHGVSQSRAPPADDVPGTVRGPQSTGGAELVVSTLEQRGRLATGDDERYLVASLRTSHNRYVLPAASVSATADAGGESVFDDDMRPTLDADLGYHYGAVVPTGKSLDDVTVRVETPPQVSRHEGYETAFYDFDAVTL
jgi:hypothetical protein